MSTTTEMCYPMPSLALAPAAWYLGAHMLRCLQDANMKIETECGISTTPEKMTADKGTQTVMSHVQKKSTGRKTPSKSVHRRVDSRASVDETKKQRSVSRSSMDARPPSRSAKTHPVPRHPNKDAVHAKTENVFQKSGELSSNKSRPTKGQNTNTKSRRLSTGDCPKRTPGSCADEDMAKWLKNPVYASDGESDGRRTDRSEMSLPWVDISKATKITKQQDTTSTTPAIKDQEKKVRHVPTRVHSTRPKMDAVQEIPVRTLNLRKEMKPEMISAPNSTPNSATDQFVLEIIKRKLGASWDGKDTESLREVTNARIRELTEKYKNCKRKSESDVEFPTFPVDTLRTRESADSIYQRGNVQRERSIENGTSYSTVIETGWLWEASSRTTKANFNRLNVRPKKSLGQHFVTDEAVLERIVAATGIQPEEPVIEFGPGTGNLTRQLLKTGAHIIAIEKDDVLTQKLTESYKEKNLEVLRGDVLRVDLRGVISKLLEKHKVDRIKIVSNLPYNITTDCLKLCLPMGDVVSNLLFMIQDEVAKRLCTKDSGDSTYRAMTVYTQHFSDPEYRFLINRAVYYPQPLVDGAFVDFKLKRPNERRSDDMESKFLAFVWKSFSSKRKKLSNSLRPLYEPEAVANVLSKSNLPETTRGQELTYDQFVLVFNALEGVEDPNRLR